MAPAGGNAGSLADCHYGHLARDGREHAIRLLDLNAPEMERWTLVDAGWTSKSPTVAHRDNANSI
ncbi:MAG: hypothetical protein M3P12_07085 [Gemmatimonadota bacterium]|nr:hypothetical protein [Gemmatimonadota bacterium]